MVVVQLDEFVVHVCVRLECPHGEMEVFGDRAVGFCQVWEIYWGYGGHPEHKIKGEEAAGGQNWREVCEHPILLQLLLLSCCPVF